MTEFTENAAERIKKVIAEDSELEGKALRVFVQGGGCIGFQYGFSFDEEEEGDTVTEVSGIKFLVDPMSIQYLNDATVDFVSNLEGDRFVITNPSSKNTCGCGQSFSV